MIKKFFFDCYDNFFTVVVFNLIYILYSFLFSSILSLNNSPFFLLIVLGIGGYIFYLLLFITSEFAKDIAFFKKVDFKKTLSSLKLYFKYSLFFYAYSILFPILFFYSSIYYLKLGTMFSMVLTGFIFWFTIIFLLSLTYIIPINIQLDKNFFKVIKKSFILFFDNTLFTLFLFVFALLFLGLSSFVIFLFPGIFGVCVLYQVAFKLRMYKYDYLQENQDKIDLKDKVKIPWSALLQKDRELVGHRTFRNTIFPWKD